MVRKPSHGWSTQNQGGFRRSTRVKQVYKAPERPSDALTIRQASSKGYSVQIRCLNPDCLHEKVEYALNMMTDFPSVADDTLADIMPKSRCVRCGKIGTAQMKFEKLRP